MSILAIDPGVVGLGNACAAGAVYLHGVWFERMPRIASSLKCRTPSVSDVVVERPALQGNRSRQANPRDLMNLAWEGALLAGAYASRYGARLVEWTPADWKGSEPKPQNHRRLWKVLTPAERELLGGARTEAAIAAAVTKGALDRWGKPGVAYYPRSFTTHNLLDAAAMFAVHVGRLERI